MDNVEEMDKFLEKYNFPKLDQLNKGPTCHHRDQMQSNLKNIKEEEQMRTCLVAQL